MTNLAEWWGGGELRGRGKRWKSSTYIRSLDFQSETGGTRSNTISSYLLPTARERDDQTLVDKHAALR